MTVSHELAAPAVIFGIDPLWYSVTLFALTYLLIITERLNRAIVSISAACLMILGGVITQQAAFNGVDFNTLGLLTGMMIIVGVSKESGMFQYVAVWATKRVNADPWGILVVLTGVTALFSAFLDNVTTVLLIAPVTLLITESLKINPYPFLFAEIFASNIGGTATLIGDPPNIMIGSATGLDFNQFLLNLAPISLFILPLMLIPVYLIWGRKLHTEEKYRKRVMAFNEASSITDPRLLKQSLFVLALVMTGFVLAHQINLQPATIAMSGAALLLILTNLPKPADKQTKSVDKALKEVEWITIFFFIGLFIVVYAVETTGALEQLAHGIIELTAGDRTITTLAILWISAIASSIIDNIPFVATMIPLIKDMADSFGGPENLNPMWWALALGSCLGGNGSLVGASANLIVAGFAERSGQPIRFLPFMLMAFPLMLLSILIASVYVYLRYL
ncbi:MAG TPA: hypothetical protein ENJ35_02100 [Gammaproteobacteria bacterium]|nr:hypothetical protein [Gammaproteobacteria bacterium]